MRGWLLGLIRGEQGPHKYKYASDDHHERDMFIEEERAPCHCPEGDKERDC